MVPHLHGAYGPLEVGGALRLRLEAERNETEKRRNGDAVKKEDRGQKTIANFGARSRSDGFRLGGVHPTTKLVSPVAATCPPSRAAQARRAGKAAPTVLKTSH